MRIRRQLAAVCWLLPLTGMAASAPNAGPSPTSAPSAWSLLFVREGAIWIAAGDGSGQHRLIEGASTPAWSPDRTRIGFVREGAVWVAAADGGQQRRLVGLPQALGTGPVANATTLSWDPKTDRLTYSAAESLWLKPTGGEAGAAVEGCAIFDVATAEPCEQPRVHFDLFDQLSHYVYGTNCAPAWSPSGEYLAFARNGDIWLAQRIGLVERDVRTRPAAPLTWRWEAARIAAVARQVESTNRGATWGYGVTGISWSPDGKALAYAVERLDGPGFSGIRLLELAPDENSPVLLSVTAERKLAEGICPSFSPDGRSLAYAVPAGSQAGVWTISLEDGARRCLIENAAQPAW